MNDTQNLFGISWTLIVLQVLVVLHLCLWVIAALRVARSIRGLGAVGWIGLGLVVPFAGPATAMFAAQNHVAHAPE